MRPTYKRRYARLTLAVGGLSLALLLGACENVREQLGLNKSSPDEFSVLTNAPLSLPPDYSLRPPVPGATRPQETSVQDQVKAALFKASPENVNNATSAGENALLSRAGTSEEDSNIRTIINRDNAIYAEEGDSFVDSMIFWRDKQVPGTIVDPTKEDQRLQEAEATGEDPSLGETAIIQRRSQGLLEGIF